MYTFVYIYRWESACVYTGICNFNLLIRKLKKYEFENFNTLYNGISAFHAVYSCTFLKEKRTSDNLQIVFEKHLIVAILS